MLNPPLLLVGSTMLTVIRKEAERYEGGRVVEGSSRKVLLRANVQPILRSTDTFVLPEVDRSRATLKVYSSEPLRQRKEGDEGYAADQFEWKGELYEVMKVVDYDMGTLNHFKAICARVELT